MPASPGRVVAIVQARLGSTRLPRKVLAEIGGRPMLEHVVTRARRARRVDEVWVATSDAPADDAVAALCERHGWPVFRGSESDVLSRYAGCAACAKADVVVRLTADCPLLDPAVVDAVVEMREQSGADYASNTLPPRSFPRGLDAEAFTRQALDEAHAEARAPHEREHVTPYLHREDRRFARAALRETPDRSQHRWTVDTPDDLALVERIARHFGERLPQVGWREILDAVERHPEWSALNAHVAQKPVA